MLLSSWFPEEIEKAGSLKARISDGCMVKRISLTVPSRLVENERYDCVLR